MRMSLPRAVPDLPSWQCSLAAAALMLAPVAALAHGNADWIRRNPDYIARDGTACCGPQDCDIAEPGELERLPDGWRHRPTGSVLRDKQIGVYPSIDTRLWRCVRDGQLMCVFRGPGM